jgi:hypothetical protein
VKGYTLSPASDAERASVVKLARSYGEVLGGITVRRVRQGDTRLGTLVLHGVDPAVEGNRTVERSLVSGLLTGLDRGAKTSRTRVGGQELIVARISGATLVAWYRRGVLAIVLGSSADPVLTFAKAYVKAS